MEIKITKSIERIQLADDGELKMDTMNKKCIIYNTLYVVDRKRYSILDKFFEAFGK